MRAVAIKIPVLLVLIHLCGSTDGQAFSRYGSGAEAEGEVENRIISNLKLSENLQKTDIRQALAFARSALEDAVALNSVEYIAKCKYTIGSCYSTLGIDRESLPYLNDALILFSELNDIKKKAETLLLLGNIYYNSNVYDLAMKNFRQVSYYGKEMGDTLLTIKGAIGQGSVYGNTDRFDSAMVLFNESFLLARQVGDLATEVQSLFYIGDVFLYSGRPEPALDKFFEVINGYDLVRINPGQVASLYNSITYAYIITGNLQKAILYSEKTGEALGTDARLRQLSTYYLNRFRIDTAEHHYSSAVDNYLFYRVYFDSINNSEFRETITNLNIAFDLKQKEIEVNQLRNENQVKDLKIRQRRLVNYGSAAMVFLLLVIICLVLRNSRKIKEKNQILQSQGEELTATLSNLQSAQDQLIQSEKMAALGLLASGVSHEINNPLNYIVGSVQYLKDQCSQLKGESSSNISFSLDAITTGVNKVTAIVTGLNRFSRSGESSMKMIDLHEMLDTCALMLNHLLIDRIELRKEYSDTKCSVCGDESKLHQVFLSILLNAIQSIESIGVITIRTEVRDENAGIVITDSGCGISAENLPNIFNPFFTTRNPGEGLGLGLSIAYRTLIEHNGSISVTSNGVNGTTVTISLPACNPGKRI